MKEKEIENNILFFLNNILGIRAWKVQSVGIYDPIKKIYRKSNNKYHKKGTADITGIMPNGRRLEIEVKNATGRLSPEQRSFIVEINESGGIAFVARSVLDVVTNLSKFFPDNDNLKKMAQSYTIPEKYKEQ